MNHGMSVHKEFRFVDVHWSRKYGKYDPFIFVEIVINFLYAFSKKTRDKTYWRIIIKTKPRARVDNSYILELSYQEDMMSNVNVAYDDVPLKNMRDKDRNLEEVDFDIIVTNEQACVEVREEENEV